MLSGILEAEIRGKASGRCLEGVLDGSLRVQLPPKEKNLRKLFPVCSPGILEHWRGPGGVSAGFQSFLKRQKQSQEVSCGRGQHKRQLLLPKV